MDLSIDYRLSGTGWSDCIVTAANGRCELTASYLSDALGNLVLAALGVISGFRTLSFGFDEEPGEYRWVIDAIDLNEIKLQVLAFDELWGSKPNSGGKLLFETTCRPIVFATAVEHAAATVLNVHGEEGYLEKWSEHPFPTRQLALLRERIGLLQNDS